MKLAVDVQYREDVAAQAAGLLFDGWADPAPVASVTVQIADLAPYRPGAFYARELPCLLALLDRLETPPEVIVIDGYVTLGAECQPGLGAHLFDALKAKVPVIGVAKTWFRGTPETAELRRGASARPLYVTAAGMTQEAAKAHIAAMHGAHRMPTLLAEVDRLARAGLTG